MWVDDWLCTTTTLGVQCVMKDGTSEMLTLSVECSDSIMLLMQNLLLSLEKEVDLSGYLIYIAQEMSQISQNAVTVDGVCRIVDIIEMSELCVQVRCSICTFYWQITMYLRTTIHSKLPSSTYLHKSVQVSII